MNWKLFTIIGFALLLLVGGYFLLSETDSSSSIEPATQKPIHSYASQFDTVIFETLSTEREVWSIIGDDGISISRGESELFIQLPQVVNYNDNGDGSYSITHGQYEGLFYMIDDDTLEWEIHAPSAPSTDCYSFPITSQNLNFYYQPPLDEEWTNNPDAYPDAASCNATTCLNGTGVEVATRPENVVGSYALYNGREKIMHLYRPFVTHSKGTNWLDWNITDTEMAICGFDDLPGGSKNLVIDPTFGYTSLGASSTARAANTKFGWAYNATENATIVSGEVVAHDAWSGDTNVTMHVYNDTGSNYPDALLLETSVADVTVSGGSNVHQVFGELDIVNGTKYWYGTWISGSTTMYQYYDSAEDLAGGRVTDTPPIDDPWSAGSLTPSMHLYTAWFNYKKETTACESGNCEFDHAYISDDLGLCDNAFEGSCNLEDQGLQIKWDVSEFCDLGVDVDTAYLQMYISSVTGTPDATSDIWRVDDQTWDESDSAATIESQTITNNSEDDWTSTTANTFTNITVTDVIQATCDESESNASIRLEQADNNIASIDGVEDVVSMYWGRVQAFPPGNNHYLRLDSRENNNVTRRPKLFINYTAVAGDETDPVVNLISPSDGSGSPDYNQTFTCLAYDNTNVTNVSLYGNFTGSWALFETNTSSINNTNYEFDVKFNEIYTNQSTRFSLNTSNTNPAGVSFNGTDIYVTDSTDEVIYHYNSTGFSLDSCDTNAIGIDNPRGIWNNGTHLFVVDDLDDDIHIITYGATCTAISSFSTGTATQPYGLTGYGDYLFVYDIGGETIHNYTHGGTENNDWSVSWMSTGRDLFTPNGEDFYLGELTGDAISVTNGTGYEFDDLVDISNSGGNALGLDGSTTLRDGRPESFFIIETDNDIFDEYKSVGYDDYIWNCEACDNSSNCAFNDTNYSISLGVGAIEIDTQSPGNFTYNANDGLTNLTCNYTSTNALSTAWIEVTKFFGGWYVNKTYNITEADTNSTHIYKEINLTNGWYQWKCNATDTVSTFNESDISWYQTGKGKILIHHSMHTEYDIDSGNKNTFSNDLDNASGTGEMADFRYEPGANVYDTFDPTWRNAYNDSFGDPNTFSWDYRMDELACESVQGCSVVIDAMAPYEENITLFNDGKGWHYHSIEWYNYTQAEVDEDGTMEYNESLSCPGGGCQPAEWWNQMPILDNETILRDESSQAIAEKILAIFIIDTDFYPVTYVSGWLWENNNFSNWIEDFVPFTYNNYAGLSSTDTNEPFENVYNWDPSPTTAYNPSSTDYRIPGELDRIVMPCEAGYDFDRINESFQWADNGTDVVYCYYDHTYSATKSNVEAYHRCLNSTKWSGGCTGGSDLSVLYPDVQYQYGDDIELVQEWLELSDTTPPTFELWIEGDMAFTNSTEELWKAPVFAIQNDTSYYLIIGEENGTNQWKMNTSGYNLVQIRSAGIDLAYNPSFSEIVLTQVNITAPLESSPYSVSYPQNITVNFTVQNVGTYITSGVDFVNASIGNAEATNTTTPTYAGNNIWQVNITVPDLSGSQNLTLNVTHTDTGQLVDTEDNAVTYDTCTYSGSGTWYVDCLDNCTATSYDLGGNPIIIYNTGGYFIFGAQVTNFAYIMHEVGCRVDKKDRTFRNFW